MQDRTKRRLATRIVPVADSLDSYSEGKKSPCAATFPGRLPLLAALALARGLRVDVHHHAGAGRRCPRPRRRRHQGSARARTARNLHAEIAAGFYERGQMDVALQELRGGEARLRPTRRSTTSTAWSTRRSDRTTTPQQNFRKAIELAPNDSEIRQNWGWYLCTHGQAQRVDPGVRAGRAQSAVQDARHRADQRRPLLGLDSATTQRAEEYFRRALPINPNNPQAAYNLSLLAYSKGGSAKRAR